MSRPKPRRYVAVQGPEWDRASGRPRSRWGGGGGEGGGGGGAVVVGVCWLVKVSGGLCVCMWCCVGLGYANRVQIESRWGGGCACWEVLCGGCGYGNYYHIWWSAKDERCVLFILFFFPPSSAYLIYTLVVSGATAWKYSLWKYHVFFFLLQSVTLTVKQLLEAGR